jgi:hypothetical protein
MRGHWFSLSLGLLAEPVVAETDDPRKFFMEEDYRQLLSTEVEDLALTNECKNYLRGRGYKCLQDFIQAGWAEQKRDKAFDVHYFNEVISFLSKKDILYLMEER